MKLLRSAVPFVALLSSGCSSDDPASSEVSLASLPSSIAAAYCRVIFHCDGASIASARVFYASEGECTSSFPARQFSDLQPLAALVNAGRVRYDAQQAARCVEALGTTCAAGAQPAACALTFTGTVAAGGSCERDEVCAGDTYCDLSAPTTGCGTCRARRPLGQSCSNSGDCSRAGVQGTPTCSFALGANPSDPPVRTCVDERTAAPAAEGQPCGTAMTSSNVYVSTPCAPGLVCGSDTGMSSTCRRPAALGMPCSPTPGCAGSAVCVRAAGADTGTCMAQVVRNAAGEACQTAGAAEVCNPVRRLHCDAGRCVASGDGTVGATCDDSGECNTGLYCNDPASGARTCQAQLADGAACTIDAACRSGYCDLTRMVCQTQSCR